MFDCTTQLFHFCHVYAALDHLDRAMLEDRHSSGVPTVKTFLPNRGFLSKTQFSDQQGLADWHTSPNYSKEMSEASTVVIFVQCIK